MIERRAFKISALILSLAVLGACAQSKDLEQNVAAAQAAADSANASAAAAMEAAVAAGNSAVRAQETADAAAAAAIEAAACCERNRERIDKAFQRSMSK